MKKISLYIPPGLTPELQAILDREGLTLSQLIRNLLSDYVKGIT